MGKRREICVVCYFVILLYFVLLLLLLFIRTYTITNNPIFFSFLFIVIDLTTTRLTISHSVYVGQVDYMTTPEELLGHFEACGTVERVTIVCDKYTGKPKGRYSTVI